MGRGGEGDAKGDAREDARRGCCYRTRFSTPTVGKCKNMAAKQFRSFSACFRPVFHGEVRRLPSLPTNPCRVFSSSNVGINISPHDRLLWGAISIPNCILHVTLAWQKKFLARNDLGG